jgi:putative protease
MTGREANTGECTQPCRWKYRLVEEKRPGEYFPVIEEDGMTTIMSSKDLCLIEHIPEIVKSGVSAVKIEGRMKSSYYAAVVVSAYRAALDSYKEKGERYEFNPKWREELKKVNHRDYTDGFYSGQPDSSGQNYEPVNYIKNYEFLGLVKSYDKKRGLAEVEQKNKFVKGDKIEIINPQREYFTQQVGDIYNEEMEPVESAPHSGQTVWMESLKKVEKNYIIRKKINKEKEK